MILFNPELYRNSFVDSLSRILQEGSTMDESTIFKVPMDLLEYMDLEGDTNFDAYMRNKESEREANTKAVADRVNYLQVLILRAFFIGL